ncbi:MAG: bifunctional FO biosynthesis protein CofGH [Actinomycetales bacterium]
MHESTEFTHRESARREPASREVATPSTGPSPDGGSGEPATAEASASTRWRPTATAIRRALRRAENAGTLDAAEVATLTFARGDDLDRLTQAAARVRDAGVSARHGDPVVTYSPKVFIPLTRLCRDRCHYCTFVATPGQLRRAGEDLFLSPDEVLAIARRGAELGCAEALLTLGDRPEDRWPEAAQWLESRGYASTLEYVRATAVLILEETGLLPHLNPGVMSWAELNRLKPVAPSMGMMLESTSRRLFEVPGQPHYGSPDKDPAVRLRTLTDAGRLAIPFTTGLLVGIGETPDDVAETLFAIRAAHAQFGHVQEVIVQNFRAKPGTAMRATPDAGHDYYRAVIALARLVLGPKMVIQAPPNLTDLAELPALLAAGVDDWGGVSPLTPDHVNPERAWPDLAVLGEATAASGFELRARLTAHPRYVLAEEPWIDPRVQPHVRALADQDGLLRSGARAQGIAWQEPEPVWQSSGRVDLQTGIDAEGRRTATRSDIDAVYGDWAELAAQVGRGGATAGQQPESTAAQPESTAAQPPETTASPAIDRSPESIPEEVKAALRAAESNPAGLNEQQALTLMTAQGTALDAVCQLADRLRADAVGDLVSYVVTRNINFTNVCYVGCRFCAFAQRRTDADAFTLSLEEVSMRAKQAWQAGATEVCMQGGIHPDLPGTGYFDLARAVKSGAPGLHLHAFSPMEVMNGVARTGLSVREFLTELKAAGVDSIPGTAAEILDDEVRWVLTKGKLPASAWREVVSTAHSIGLPSTSTMMYGHVDEPRHWVAHLRTLADIQRETGGFTEFVPLPFVHSSSPIYLAGLARPGPTQDENRAVHALARILLHGLIDNIQVSWVKLGVPGAVAMLRGGCNDLGGTLMEETISRMAGSENGSWMTPHQLEAVAEAAERPWRQRTTLYGQVPAERVNASRAVRSYLDLTDAAAPGRR